MEKKLGNYLSVDIQRVACLSATASVKPAGLSADSLLNWEGVLEQYLKDTLPEFPWFWGQI